MFLVAAALLAANAGSVAAKDFEPVGGAGTNAGEFRDHCPPNTFLVGLEVKSGAWVDRMAIRCAAVKDDGSLGPLVPSAATTHGGNGGGAPVETTCGPRRIIASMGLKMTPGNKEVLFFHFFCRSTFGDDPAASGTMEIGAKSTVFADIKQDCGPDEVAIGIQGRSGVHVNAAGLMCGPKPAPTGLYDAFKTWISANDFKNATISVNGSLTAGFGTRTASAMVPIASLSKAITGMCIAQLVDAGRMA
jgi:hypothetical protein